MIAFGPVPSRRLGQSLGINNIPPKNCTYNCIYCQVGTTDRKDLKRRTFYDPEKIYHTVHQRVKEVKAAEGRIDYLTIVPDGEPTLDIHLGKIIERLRLLDIKIAVITNSSLMWREDVREELALADLVSMKIDAVDEEAWCKLNRPDPDLSFPEIISGILSFTGDFEGKLITETMLVKGINDRETILKETAELLENINPDTAYIAIPTRPPSETWVRAPEEEVLNQAFQIFSKHLENVELLTGYSEQSFSSAGDVVQNLLHITSVHPMRESEVIHLLNEKKVPINKLTELLDQELLVKVKYQGQPFYVRKMPFINS